MLTKICTWSGIKCPSSVSLLLYTDIAPLVFYLNLFGIDYISIFLLYLGVNTIWYLHIYFVCANAFALLDKKITLLFINSGSDSSII